MLITSHESGKESESLNVEPLLPPHKYEGLPNELYSSPPLEPSTSNLAPPNAIGTTPLVRIAQFIQML